MKNRKLRIVMFGLCCIGLVFSVAYPLYIKTMPERAEQIYSAIFNNDGHVYSVCYEYLKEKGRGYKITTPRDMEDVCRCSVSKTKNVFKKEVIKGFKKNLFQDFIFIKKAKNLSYTEKQKTINDFVSEAVMFCALAKVSGNEDLMKD